MSHAAAANSAAPVVKKITAEQVQTNTHRFLVDSWNWFQANWLQILIALAAGAAIALVLMAVRRLGTKLCERPALANGWGLVLGRAVTKTSNFFIVMVASRLVVGYAEAPPAVATTAGFLFTVATVFQAAVWAREIILGAVEHRTSSADHAMLDSAFGLIRVLVTFGLFAIAFIVVLDNLGVNVTGLVAGLGVGGIAIGLAAQGIFADLFAALAIIFDRPFRAGDSISYDQSSGTVEAIGLKSTRVRGINGEQRILANKALLDKEIQNNTQRERRRMKLLLGLVYDTPAATCRAVPDMLRELIEGLDFIFVRAGFVSFGESSLDFEVEFESPSPDYQRAYDARHAVGIAILERFNAEGIGFAFPTRTIDSPDAGGGGAAVPLAAPAAT